MRPFVKRTLAFLVPLLAALLSAAAPARALPPPWIPLGPFGGGIQSLTADPARSGTLYATTGAGLFKTADGGASWKSIYDGTPGSNLAVDPLHPSTLYVAVYGAILIKSTDGGAHWAPSAGGLIPDPVFVPRILGIDPTNPNRLLLTYGQGLWRSANAGASWQPANAGLPDAESTQISAIAIAGGPAGTAFVATPDGVYRTVDAGVSWQLAAGGLPAAQFVALAAAPSDPRTVYATGPGLYRSTDGGATWRQASAFQPSALIVSPRSPATLYGVSGRMAFRSADGGAHWTALSGVPNPVVLAPDPTTTATVYAGTSGGVLAGVFRSDDQGATWTRRSQGISSIPAYALAVDPSDPNRLWTNTGFIFRSANQGAGWARVPASPFQGPGTRLAIGASSAVFASGVFLNGRGFPSFSIWKTANQGATWTQVFAPRDGDITVIRAAPSALSTLYAAGQSPVDGPRIYRSTDNGAAWEVRSSGSPPLPDCALKDLAVAPSAAAVVYVAGSAHRQSTQCDMSVVRSGDGGATWTDVSAGLPSGIASVVAVDPQDPNVVYVGTGDSSTPGDGVWKSTNGGQTWNPTGAEIGNRTITALLATAIPGRLYAALIDGRIFRSDDGGASWQGRSRNLHTSKVYALVADPGDPHRVYAATANGVWTLTETD
ncbi:MAG TPA: hypothetical protein VGH73_19810 [Thermoanaerobaculia bacterium]